MKAFALADSDGFFHRSFDSIQFPLMERRHGDLAIPRGLYRVTMDIEDEPSTAIDKSRFLNKKDEAFRFLCLSISWDTEDELGTAIDKSIFLNKKDEAFGFLCLSISWDLLFHLSGLKTPRKFGTNWKPYMESRII